MNIFYPVALAAVAAAVIAGSNLPHDAAEASSAATNAGESEARYQLVVYGAEPSCAVSAGALIAKAKRNLMLGQACSEINPELTGARYWIERPNGRIAFAEDDGDVVAEFAVADGAAFETFDPDAPMMVLLAGK